MTQVEMNKAFAAFKKAVDHLKDEFSQLQTGRASAGMVDRVVVESYGVTQPLKAVASINIPDGSTIQISPWDKGLLPAIEQAIRNSDLNLNPVNNGAGVILNIPPLTEERRRDLVKVVGRMAEEAKISVRNARHDAMSTFKRMAHDSEITEDDQKRAEKQLQEKVDEVNKEIVEAAKQKEEQVMTV